MDESTKIARELVRIAKMLAAADPADKDTITSTNGKNELNDEDKLKINEIVKALKLDNFKKWLSGNKTKTVKMALGTVSSMNLLDFFSLIIKKSQEQQ